MLLILLPLQSKPFHFYLSHSVSFLCVVCFSLFFFERTQNDIMSTQYIAFNTFICIHTSFIVLIFFVASSLLLVFFSSHIMTVNRANSKNPLKTHRHAHISNQIGNVAVCKAEISSNV